MYDYIEDDIDTIALDEFDAYMDNLLNKLSSNPNFEYLSTEEMRDIIINAIKNEH